eukprot:8114055-Pyramimonas_sp.AAC.1
MRNSRDTCNVISPWAIRRMRTPPTHYDSNGAFLRQTPTSGIPDPAPDPGSSASAAAPTQEQIVE